MNSFDREEKIQQIIKYGKWVLLVLVVFAVFFLIKNSKRTYNNIEDDVVVAAKKYVADNNLAITSPQYIEITKLSEIEGTELCSKASGVMVTNTNGKIAYEPYLNCSKYQTDTSVNTKYIVLVGGNFIVLNKGEVFNDPYYTLKKEADVIVSGKVLTTPGIYTLIYSAYVDNILKETVKRYVVVTENDKDSNVSGLINETDPVITLLGDKNIVLQLNSRYKEPGYKAVDYNDGKISRRVDVTSNLDTKKVGTYFITYKVTNSKGRTAVAQRTIKVMKFKGDVEISLKQESTDLAASTNIIAEISGSTYVKLIDPYGSVDSRRTHTFTAKSNGVYTFKAYDIHGNEYVKDIEISNIDNIPPAGSCKALVRGDNTEVEVNATDNKGIAGYSYILDGNATSYITDNTYKVTNKSETVSVSVVDIAGNKATLKCDVTIIKETIVAATDLPTNSGSSSSGSSSSGSYSNGGTGTNKAADLKNYKLVATQNNVIDLANYTEGNVAQRVNKDYYDSCLSFAYYYAYKLYNGDNLNSMNAKDGAGYVYASKFKDLKDNNKQTVLQDVYSQVSAGKPTVLQVSGAKSENGNTVSRHYVTVVGYKNTVKSGSTMTDKDLLIIDSWDGKLKTMDEANSRYMISGYDTGRTGSSGYGYQVYNIK